MPRPRILTDEWQPEIERVARLRATIPSNKALARLIGCSVATVKAHINLAMKTVSRETNGDMIRDHEKSSADRNAIQAGAVRQPWGESEGRACPIAGRIPQRAGR